MTKTNALQVSPITFAGFVLAALGIVAVAALPLIAVASQIIA